MKKILKFLSALLVFCITISLNLYSQNNQSVLELEHGTNKLNVVIGVIVLIFLGITLFLISLDRKVKKIKKDIDHSSQN